MSPTVRHQQPAAGLPADPPLVVAFLGPEGTFSHIAARRLFEQGARYREVGTIDGVFDAVRAGDVAYGVVPVENSTEGSVTASADALIEGDFLVEREIVLDVAHALLGRQGLAVSAVKRVHSHPQALAQCRGWLAKNLPDAELAQASSTAAAARETLANPASACIGSPKLIELFPLEILQESIQDRAENATRFFVIARGDAARTPRTGHDKSTIVFSLKDGRGALRNVLGVFDDAGVNLTRIESRPSRQKRWDYVFLIDVEGHREDPAITLALSVLVHRCEMVKVVGSYARAGAEASSGTVPRAG